MQSLIQTFHTQHTKVKKTQFLPVRCLQSSGKTGRSPDYKDATEDIYIYNGNVRTVKILTSQKDFTRVEF